jgi:hypothetical protein
MASADRLGAWAKGLEVQATRPDRSWDRLGEAVLVAPDRSWNRGEAEALLGRRDRRPVTVQE